MFFLKPHMTKWSNPTPPVTVESEGFRSGSTTKATKQNSSWVVTIATWVGGWTQDMRSNSKVRRISTGILSRWTVTPIYKPWSSAIWKGSHNPIFWGGLLTMVIINHLQVLETIPFVWFMVMPHDLGPPKGSSGRESHDFQENRFVKYAYGSRYVLRKGLPLCSFGGGMFRPSILFDPGGFWIIRVCSGVAVWVRGFLFCLSHFA